MYYCKEVFTIVFPNRLSQTNPSFPSSGIPLYVFFPFSQRWTLFSPVSPHSLIHSKLQEPFQIAPLNLESVLAPGSLLANSRTNRTDATFPVNYWHMRSKQELGRNYVLRYGFPKKILCTTEKSHIGHFLR